MNDSTPFDHAPDPELGGFLREALTGPAPEAFLRRLRGAVTERDNQWDVLERWARPRVLAAAVAAGVLLWLGVWRFAEPEIDVGLMVASNRAATIMSTQMPAPEDLMAALSEAR